MTLIIATVLPNKVLVTADSRVTTYRNNRPYKTADNAQKLFVLQDCVVAMIGAYWKAPRKSFTAKDLVECMDEESPMALGSGDLALAERWFFHRRSISPTVFTWKKLSRKIRRSKTTITGRKPITFTSNSEDFEHYLRENRPSRAASLREFQAFHRKLQTVAAATFEGVGGPLQQILISPGKIRWLTKPSFIREG